MELHPEPTRLQPWLREIWGYRDVISILVRKDFQTRYKRASLGILWAVFLPLIQALVFVAIFSRVGHFQHLKYSYPIYVLSGTLAWSYYSTAASVSSTAIVDGATLTDKVWFPRCSLVIVPVFSNLFGLFTSMVLLLAAMPLFHAHYTLRLFLLIPAMVWCILFAFGFGLCTSALHVYFRDVRFIVQAAVLIWFYVTPIVYPASALKSIGPYFAYNPMTGIINLFQYAAAGRFGPMGKGFLVSAVATVLLLVIGLHAHRRRDRLFVDLL